MRDIYHSDAQFERVSDFQSDEINPEVTAATVNQPTVHSTHPVHSAHPSDHPSAHSSSATSATDHQSSDNHPPSVDHLLPAAHVAAGSHTIDKNPLNDS